MTTDTEHPTEVTYNGVTYIAERGYSCDGCAFATHRELCTITPCAGVVWVKAPKTATPKTPNSNPETKTATPHVHAELIKAWADGAEIEFLAADNNWYSTVPSAWDSNKQYRIAPTKKPDVTFGFTKEYLDTFFVFCMRDGTVETRPYWKGDALKLTFDGETGEFKGAEVFL